MNHQVHLVEHIRQSMSQFTVVILLYSASRILTVTSMPSIQLYSVYPMETGQHYVLHHALVSFQCLLKYNFLSFFTDTFGIDTIEKIVKSRSR